MRRLLVALGLVGGLLSPAFAADYDLPILRGSESAAGAGGDRRPRDIHALERLLFRRRGQLQLAQPPTFPNATLPLLDFSLRELTLERRVHPSAGARQRLRQRVRRRRFSRLQHAVAGPHPRCRSDLYAHELEHDSVTANRRLAGTPPVTDPRVFSANGASTMSTSLGTGNLDLTDYGDGPVPGRICRRQSAAIWLHWRCGRASKLQCTTHRDLASKARASPSPIPRLKSQTCDPSCTCRTFYLSNSAGQNNALLWGYSVGGGLDWALTPECIPAR